MLITCILTSRANAWINSYRKGFITRVRASDDERGVNLYLTEKAERALCNLEKKSEGFDPILQMISKEKFDTIIKGLEAVEEVLQFVIEQKCIDNKRG